MEISRFGSSYASLFRLSNRNGMQVVLTDIGADIVSIFVPDRNGNPVDVALGYDKPEHYESNDSVFGAVVGRYANRIGGAAFTLNGVRYTMDVNDNHNCLHGGFQHWFSRRWYPSFDKNREEVKFRLFSVDGDQGMPGNASVEVTYELTEDNELRIHYLAVSDRDTYFNLTNHCYFNLSGEETRYVLDHELWLDADRITEVDDELIPTGRILDIRGTAMDFTEPKPLGRDIDADYAQLKPAIGYDHNYLLNDCDLSKAFARISSPKTSIAMEVFTDLPAVQLYSGNHMGEDPNGKGGKGYPFRGGFCLESQYCPDTPNHENFPSNLFRAGETLSSTTVYKFSVKA